MLKAAPQAVNAPRGDEIELAAHGRRQHAIERGPLAAALRAAYSLIYILARHFPTVVPGDAPKLFKLVSALSACPWIPGRRSREHDRYNCRRRPMEKVFDVAVIEFNDDGTYVTPRRLPRDCKLTKRYFESPSFPSGIDSSARPLT